MKLMAYYILRFSVLIVSFVPFPILYLLSDGLAFVLGRILGYRKKVILQNLQKAFPNYPPSKHIEIQQAFYVNFCDLLLESIKGLSMSEQSLKTRYHYSNPELLDQAAKKNGGVLLLGSHLTNWEWGVLSFSMSLESSVLGIFKPLSNPYVDRYLSCCRRRFGLKLSSMKRAGRAIIEHRQQATVFVLIADQSPSDTRNAHWISFFGQETAFLQGPDKLARKTGYPVFQFDIQRVKRGYYEVSFESIELSPKGLKEGGITKRFAGALEERIKAKPADWLWSHRRWKWKREVRK